MRDRFDDRERLGRLALQIGEEDFAMTYNPPNYEPDDKSVRC